MGDQRSVERASNGFRDLRLDCTSASFAPWTAWAYSEPLQHAPDVGVYRTDRSSQRIQHDTTSRLPGDSGQTHEVRLSLFVRKRMKACEVEPALARFHLVQDCLKVGGLGRRESRITDHRHHFVPWRVSQLIPAGIGLDERLIGPDILRLLGHSRENDEDQVAERVLRVLVIGAAVRVPQPSLDFVKNLAADGLSHTAGRVSLFDRPCYGRG